VTFGVEDVLAGPIVRRVEPTLASVWIALRKPASVRLDLFRGRGRRETMQVVPAAPLPTGTMTPRGLPPDPHTLALGKSLHVAVALLVPESPTVLEWETIYSYDLRLTDEVDGSDVGFDELGLLEDRTFLGWFGEQRSLALGYQPGFLPSFILPAAVPLRLRLTQGSCRWVNGYGRDAMPIVDDLLRRDIDDPTQRLQQMWLTGDQIYADAGAPEFIRACTTIGTMLLAGEDRVVERVEVQESPSTRVMRFPVDQHHFPAGRRHVLANLTAGFTSVKQDSHALGFGEYAATYLASFHTTVWPDLKAMLEARWAEVQDYLASRDELEDLIAQVPLSVHQPKQFDKMRELHRAWRLVPAEARAIDEQNLTELDRWQLWDEQPGAVVDSWQHYWEQAAAAPGIGGVLGARFLDQSQPPFPPLPPLGFQPQSEDQRTLAKLLTPTWWAGDETFHVDRERPDGGAPGIATSDLVRQRLHLLQRFLDDLPRVRRALANIATYMTFDDHEVCDDWNITAGWVTKVRGNALGRNVLRNGLAAYLVFQGWGNDPRAFAFGTGPHSDTLRLARSMFIDDTGEGRGDGPRPEVPSALDRAFNNQPLTVQEPSLAERMPWHYRYDGPGYEFLALDSRTCRSYERDADPTIGQPFTNEANAALLTDEALNVMVPADPPAGVAEDGLCFVIAAAPVLGYPAVESIAQPLLNIMDMAKPQPTGRWARIRKAYRLGRVNYDPEHWGLMPALFERVLQRLSVRRRVLFLSGDVHYSCTHAMSYWRREGTGSQYRTSRFVQLTSSSFRTAHELALVFSIDLLQQAAKELASPIERLGWHQSPTGSLPDSPRPLEPDETFNVRVRWLQQHDPIVVAPSSLPPGVTQTRPPDWAYRRVLIEDTREDEERLAGLLPPVLQPASAGLAVMAQSVANRVAWQAEHAPDRRWVWWTNVTTVHFEVRGDGPVAVHSTHTFDLADPRSPARPYVVAVVPLFVPPGEVMPAVPPAEDP